MPLCRSAYLFPVLLALWGCRTETPATNPPETAPRRAAPTPASAAVQKEYWDAIFFADTKVGYTHTVYRNVIENGQPLVQIEAESELNLQRSGQSSTQSLRYASWETPGGEVVRFESSMRSGNGDGSAVPLQASGEIRQGKLHLELTTLGKSTTQTSDWDPACGGYFAVDQSLEAKPMQPGETRRLRTLTAGFNQPAEVELVAQSWETVATLDGNQELLRIDVALQLGQNRFDQILWTNRAGQSIKTYMPTLQQTSYRTSKERALAGQEGTYDLIHSTIVPVDRELDNVHEATRMTYRVRFQDGKPEGAFASTATQRVRMLDNQTVELAVRALGADPMADESFANESPPLPSDRSPNSLIQSDDSEVVKLANAFAADLTDPWEIAVALEKKTHETVANKNFSQSLSSAAEVARTREGDCTEHAVLLAALCRAKEIPAKVSIGLVYAPSFRGFAYHMWTVAWIRDRWVPFDATLGRGGIGCGHLPVAYTSLEGAGPLSSFLPVMRLIGNIKIEVVASQDGPE